MNPDTQNSIPTVQKLAPITVLKRKRRPHGKIAELPKALRDQINHMLDDGLSCRKIAEKLNVSNRDLPKGPISKSSVSRWHENGYQRYLEQQQRLAEVRANREASLDMVNDGDTTTLPEADLQLIASQYYDIFAQNQAHIIKQKLAEDPLHYPRFLNAFARLTREILKLTHHREQREKEKAAELKRRDPLRKLNENECGVLAKAWQDFFLGPDYDPMAHPLHDPQPITPIPTNDPPNQDATTDPNQTAALPLPQGEGRGEGEQDVRTP